MPFDFQRARPLLQNSDLSKLFVEGLGWEPSRRKLTIRIGESDYELAAIAEKRGFTAWLCETPTGILPDHPTRLKLDRKLSETSFEHLIVFVNKDRSRQLWMWVRREQGKPLAARSHEYHRGQPGDSLLQKLQNLFVSLEEEEAGLSTVAVAGRARAAFDVERITKSFYSNFDAHRKNFLKFIEGIKEVTDREWYASVMMNRLMFVYFIQRKGFLDGDPNYLRNRLHRSKSEQGKDKFYSFYRYFLLRLFHEGFGKRRKDRAPELEKLLGVIPYLNGGLFDVHELEKPERYGKNIQIPDKAFENIFDLFDQYQWHLDERPLRNDKEINPDVLGYIFEKYINQKQMGAYYTKEDITEYISKNTVLPFLFDVVRSKCKVAFDSPNGPNIWDLARENPDRYIFSAIRHGSAKALPSGIALGVDTTKPNLIERRKEWNKAAPSEYALPTEIWREVVARRQHYEEVRSKLATGKVREVNDFITLNLDLRQFAQDVIQSCEGPDLLMALWGAITTITVLDPTGGSGAFIFAALNILEPLYEACLDRMEAFLSEWGEAGRKSHPNYHKKFSEVLARVETHPNRRYFVLKSIILNNLYAVDIMEEAVEICKLRLFLKLAAQVEPDTTRDNLGIEPLPDIDFNIRTGNTLVGYATADEVRRCMVQFGGGQMKLLDENELGSFARFNTRCADVEQAFTKFRQLQTEGDGSVPFADKQELQKRLKALEDELNLHLAGEYGVKVGDKEAYARWLKSHQPFHWFIHFYGILNRGGFDVIIGNPPYVEYGKVTDSYTVKGYKTEDCGNLYGFILERNLTLKQEHGRTGMIVPHSAFCTDRMKSVQDLFTTKPLETWVSTFCIRPAKLFVGVDQRLAIYFTGRNVQTLRQFSSRYHKWHEEFRPYLFHLVQYIDISDIYFQNSLPKLHSYLERSLWHNLKPNSRMVTGLSKRGGQTIYFHNAPRYWIRAMNFAPYFWNERGGEQLSTQVKTLSLSTELDAEVVAASLNSTLFYWWFVVLSDCRHLNLREIETFPIGLETMKRPDKVKLEKLSAALMADLKKHKFRKESQYKATGKVVYDEFYPKHSKPIIDEIDTVLAGHYGFTEEELDFILNYDIKYRLGRDNETEEDA
ncbi:MAG: Eco57I restriction-modification methylase domain-containing protein [Elusimicrobia bacterium]|nr:Eco57I restriction-modification methylase domain-containing protein [Elusimicrobiota bacterium]